MEQHMPESNVESRSARRPYEAPRLVELGAVAQLTQDPQVRPQASGPTAGSHIFFLGDDA
jgi:hypothetical protein